MLWCRRTLKGKVTWSPLLLHCLRRYRNDATAAGPLAVMTHGLNSVHGGHVHGTFPMGKQVSSPGDI